jgi:ubiquinol-cytochrome c reductase cytochrome c subunit
VLRHFLPITFLIICAAADAQTPVPAGNADNGKRLYLRNGCYACHGTVGQGAQANPLAPRLAPRPIVRAAFIAYVRKPAGTMPPYTSKVMSDAELSDVWAYLASIPPPPPLKSIPLLNQ